MNIKIIAVGKLKEKYLKEAVLEYTKRLSKYCRLKILEVIDEKLPESYRIAEEKIARGKEGQRILKHINGNMYVIALDVKGIELSSEGFSDFIEDLSIKGKSNIAFVIGGSLGLSEDVLKRANYRLSFSLMTFPHQLMRVILLEQVYRGFRIIKGEPYHK